MSILVQAIRLTIRKPADVDTTMLWTLWHDHVLGASRLDFCWRRVITYIHAHCTVGMTASTMRCDACDAVRLRQPWSCKVINRLANSIFELLLYVHTLPFTPFTTLTRGVSKYQRPRDHESSASRQRLHAQSRVQTRADSSVLPCEYAHYQITPPTPHQRERGATFRSNASHRSQLPNGLCTPQTASLTLSSKTLLSRLGVFGRFVRKA